GRGSARYLARARPGLADLQGFPARQRFAFAWYGFALYWAKLFVPYRLSAFYPYPALDESGGLPATYLLVAARGGLVLALPLALAAARRTPAVRTLTLGLGFFFLMLVLVLQFVSVGSSVMADRYSYVPYIGAFYLLALAVDALLERRWLRVVTAVAVVLYSLALGVGAYRRTWVWTNSE